MIICCCEPVCDPGPDPERAYYEFQVAGIGNFAATVKPYNPGSICHNLNGTPRGNCERLNLGQKYTLPWVATGELESGSSWYLYQRGIFLNTYSLFIYPPDEGPLFTDIVVGGGWQGNSPVFKHCEKGNRWGNPPPERMTCYLRATSDRGEAYLIWWVDSKGKWDTCGALCCGWPGTNTNALFYLRRRDPPPDSDSS